MDSVIDASTTRVDAEWFKSCLDRHFQRRAVDAPYDGDTAKEWTAWMTALLHAMAAEAQLGCCCHNGSHNAQQGRNREFLWDFTWYKEWCLHEMPAVAIEHENARSEGEFLLDTWKLSLAYVPLRVSIGYSDSTTGIMGMIQSLRKTAKSAGWTFPVGSEDLVLIGYPGMAETGFRVFQRAAGETQWNDCGWQKEASRGLPPSPI